MNTAFTELNRIVKKLLFWYAATSQLFKRGFFYTCW